MNGWAVFGVLVGEATPMPDPPATGRDGDTPSASGEAAIACCHEVSPAVSGQSFADEFFDDYGGLVAGRKLRFGHEWVWAFRDGDSVFVEHGGKKFEIVGVSGFWHSAVCELVEVPVDE